jgi:hypothetical protein
MRVKKLNGQDKQKASDFCDYLLRIGEGKEATINDENNDKTYITIPESILIDGMEQQLIDSVYPNIQSKYNFFSSTYFHKKILNCFALSFTNKEYMVSRCILSPLNKNTDRFNDSISASLPGLVLIFSIIHLKSIL